MGPTSAELPSHGTAVRGSLGAWWGGGAHPRCSSRREGAEWGNRCRLEGRLPREHLPFFQSSARGHHLKTGDRGIDRRKHTV